MGFPAIYGKGRFFIFLACMCTSYYMASCRPGLSYPRLHESAYFPVISLVSFDTETETTELCNPLILPCPF